MNGFFILCNVLLRETIRGDWDRLAGGAGCGRSFKDSDSSLR